MPASRLNSMLLAFVAAALLTLAGCAGQGYNQPSAPDESVLAPAEKALNTARSAQADDFAPRAVDAARRRIATARDILYTAARAGRELDDTQKARVEELVHAARLDAKSALTQTQALAVQAKIAELQGAQSADTTRADQGNDDVIGPDADAANAGEGVQ